jgi:hypothetical protein
MKEPAKNSGFTKKGYLIFIYIFWENNNYEIKDWPSEWVGGWVPLLVEKPLGWSLGP